MIAGGLVRNCDSKNGQLLSKNFAGRYAREQEVWSTGFAAIMGCRQMREIMVLCRP